MTSKSQNAKKNIFGIGTQKGIHKLSEWYVLQKISLLWYLSQQHVIVIKYSKTPGK